MALAPAATKDAFSYAGDFYVEASGHNRHRRATVPELKTHFSKSGDGKDPPAHWYEAQLLHYGLKPSKAKGTAKMRLYEATTQGSLAVPAQLLKIEGDLKKEWTKSERAAKAALKSATAPAPAKGTKRKADDQPAARGAKIKKMSVKPDGSVEIEFEGSAKNAKPDTTTKAKAVTTPKSKAATATKAKPAASPAPRAPASTKTKTKTAKEPTPAQTPTSASVPRTKQTARRGGTTGTISRGGSIARDRKANLVQSDDFADFGDNDDPPPPYPGPSSFPGNGLANRVLQSDKVASPRGGSSGSLGLLNGRYEVSSFGGDDDDQSDGYGHGEGEGIIMTLDKSTLWGSFDLNYFQGIFHLSSRPFQASKHRHELKWRGRDIQGYTYDGDDNRGGWISFLGDGQIEGQFEVNGGISFRGHRISGNETRSEVSPAEMRSQWDDML